MNTKEVPTETLLQMYRHSKGLLTILEPVLMERGAINCPKCGVKHHPNERHTFGGLYSMVQVSA